MSAFRRLSVRKLVKQHCVDDLACLHCCKCWETHRKQYETRLAILTAANLQAKKQIEFLTNLNKQLKKQLDRYAKRDQQFKNVESMKEDFRAEITAEIMKNREVEDAINKEKIDTLEEELRYYRQYLSQLKQKLQSAQLKIRQLEEVVASNEEKSKAMEQQNSQLKQDNDNFLNQIEKLYETINEQDKRIDEKTSAIERMRATLNDVENRFVEERTKASNTLSEKQMCMINLKNRDKYIDSLTQCASENLKSMKNLESNNRELKQLTNMLDCEIIAGRANEQYLRDKLISSEQRLFLTEGFARYNQQKVELMKNDLQVLKLKL